MKCYKQEACRIGDAVEYHLEATHVLTIRRLRYTVVPDGDCHVAAMVITT